MLTKIKLLLLKNKNTNMILEELVKSLICMLVGLLWGLFFN